MKIDRLALLFIIMTCVFVPTFVIHAQEFTNPYQLAEPLPGAEDRSISSLSQYLSIAYVSLLSAAIVFGFVMLVYSGVEYITAGGNQSAIGSAKTRMVRVVKGFLIIVGAVLLLTTIGGGSMTNVAIPIQRTGPPRSAGTPGGGTAPAN